MTGLCRSHGDIHRFIITHFAQQNNVRALAEGCTQRIDIAECIDTDLTLADDTFVMPVQVFDGILQRDDMLFHRVVDLVDQTRKRGGFAASGRTGDQNHALGETGEFHDRSRNTDVFRVRELKSDDTDDRRECTTLLVSTDTETGESRNRKRKVIISPFQKRRKVTGLRQFIKLLYKLTGLRRHKPLSIFS